MGARPRVTLVAAVARNGVIGRGGALPWRLPADLRRFRAVTWGHPVVMGRRTWESIGRPLPGRRNIVVTRRRGYRAPGAEVVPSPQAALAAAAGAGEVMVIGGAEVYAAFLPLADRILLTEVEAEPEGDTFFPRLDPGEWRETARERHPADAENPFACSFVTLERASREAARGGQGAGAGGARNG